MLAAFFSDVPLLWLWWLLLLLLLLFFGQDGVVVVVVGAATGGLERIKVFACDFGEFVPVCCLAFGVGPTKRL